MEKRKIFISGPMTGKPGYNFKEFDRVELQLKSAGHDVVNPADVSRKFKEKEILKYGDAFNRMVDEQLELLKGCNVIYLLDGWERSVGVRRELSAALQQGCEVWLQTPGKCE